MPRNAAEIDVEIAATRRRQQSKATARDRREQDMLSAMRDIENYERQIRYDDRQIDKLLGERAALAQSADQ